MPDKAKVTPWMVGINALLFFAYHYFLPRDWAELLPLHHPGSGAFGLWQFVTSLFIHGDAGHLFFNMFALFSFGSLLERVWGVRRFLIFYFVVGIGAGLIHTGVNQYKLHSRLQVLEERGYPAENLLAAMDLDEDGNLMLSREVMATIRPEDRAQVVEAARLHFGRVVGASGALYGILVAFGILFPGVKLQLIFLPVPLPARIFIPGLLLLDLFSGVTGFSLFGGGIAHFAHLGGALIGFVLMLLWRKQLNRIVFPVSRRKEGA